MTQPGNLQFHGRSGKAWINSSRFSNVFNCTFTLEPKFEEMPDPEGWGDVQIPNGYGVKVSLSLRRDGTEDEIIDEIVEAAQENRLPNIDIISSMVRNDNKKENKYKAHGVTFDAVEALKFEEGSSKTEIELSGKARKLEKL